MAQGNRSKELWLVPKRVNLHQSIVFVEAILDRGYDGVNWNPQKQNNLGVNLKNKGATRSGRNISAQAIRTLLASIPQYLGFAFIDDTGSSNVIRVTDAGKILVKNHKDSIVDVGRLGLNPELEITISEVATNQLLKLQLTNPIVLKDCENIRLFPFRFLLKLLLKVEYLDLEEIAYFLLQTKDETDLELKTLEIENFRKLSNYERRILIEKFRETHIGNITLVQAPSARYFISLCEITGLIEHFSAAPLNRNNEIIAIKIKDNKKEKIKKVILPKYEGITPYDFGNNLLLWMEYFGKYDNIYTPYDADIENATDVDFFCVVKNNNKIVYMDVVNKKDQFTIPAFLNNTYQIEIYSLFNSSSLGFYTFKPQKYGDYYKIISVKEHALPEPSFLDLITETKNFVNTGRYPLKFSQKLSVIEGMTGEPQNSSMMKGAFLEYSFYKILLQLNNEGIIDEVIWNGKLERFQLPRPAPGGKNGIPDILFLIDNEWYVLEVTTIKPKALQFSAEGASVPDHIRLFAEETQKPVNGIFSAPTMHVRVNDAMKSTLKGYGLKIKCLSLDDLLTILASKNRKNIKQKLKSE